MTRYGAAPLYLGNPPEYGQKLLAQSGTAQAAARQTRKTPAGSGSRRHPKRAPAALKPSN